MYSERELRVNGLGEIFLETSKHCSLGVSFCTLVSGLTRLARHGLMSNASTAAILFLETASYSGLKFLAIIFGLYFMATDHAFLFAGLCKRHELSASWVHTYDFPQSDDDDRQTLLTYYNTDKARGRTHRV